MSFEPDSLPRGFLAAVQSKYADLLVRHLGLDAPLRAVAEHALAGGKRLRPILTEAMGASLAAPPAAVAHIGVAVEYLHAASLLLDDLPAMDNARERRGKPATHLVFSEAETILAALALTTRTTMLLLDPAIADAETGRQMARVAAETVGPIMACGQAMEFRRGMHELPEQLVHIHARKTGALFDLPGKLLSLAAGSTAEIARAVATFTSNLGLAYQLIDDLRDRHDPREAHINLARRAGAEAIRAAAHAALDAACDAARFDTTGRLAGCILWLRGGLDAVA